ncbi:MAG TPA: XRE family transcriptional regulator [Phocaeicola coprocola]|uniref:XRE family transcriptional regulator n=1 Tax=Phocaeicola coprocola TaxID=310298 RepID=A0A921FAY5_9BACT|nr:XRE family transcriptional regulator [Phocaeicola coprocola]
MEHIGQLIRQELRRQERSVAWFARQLSCDRSNIYRIFQKESIDTYLLVRISIILQYNFFSTLSLLYRKANFIAKISLMLDYLFDC